MSPKAGRLDVTFYCPITISSGLSTAEWLPPAAKFDELMFDHKRVSKLASRGLCYQSLEERRLLAGGQISPTADFCSAVTDPASAINSSMVAEGESVEDGVIA